MLTELAISYRVPLSEILKIKIDESKINALVNSSYFQAGESMSHRTGQSPRMQNILYAWYVAETKVRTVPNREICDKALEINKIVRENAKAFKATNSWCIVFKKRFNLNATKVNTFQEDYDIDAATVRRKVMDAALAEVVYRMGVDITQVIIKSFFPLLYLL